ncbi:GntR family transcriptional regulator [Paenibacillus azoreducens]|uniref:GntR family transcriptional regulator n=1 Tax=Paenibacillus azoreducens TaxID=116718 RepID=A0A919YFG8_9BACL|nr:GntR family transcriptional regulator [Paenibacillus azoreducens]GIO49774.1 GntR family transcriptional regulator [Paenibacillus azoreducens]
MPIPTDYSTPVRLSAKDRALSQIQRWIIEGTLQPEEKLNDAELASALGVSRTPVREALQILEMKGLVQMSPGKDTRVTKIEEADIVKLYAPLAALHALAAETAAPLIQPEHIRKLHELNDKFAKFMDEEDLYQAIEYDEKFHNLIVDISDNPHIASFSSSLQMHIRRYKYIFLKKPLGESQTAAQEHREIIHALEAHDAEGAARCMKRNFLGPLEEVKRLL